MHIISQKGESVNVYTSRLGIDTAQILIKEAEKWTMHKEAAARMAQKLDRIKEHARAYRMRTCATEVVYNVCQSCGRKHVIHANLCRDRFCPLCNWRLSMKRFTSMIQIVDGLRRLYPESRWQFVTLTVANCAPAELPDVITEMMRAWNCIASRKTFKRSIIGWARSMEITYNPATKTIHPHFHMLLMWAEGYAPTQFVTREWVKTVKRYATMEAQDEQDVKTRRQLKDQIAREAAMSRNTSLVVDEIPSIYDQEEEDAAAVRDAVLETYKYSVKGSDLEEMPLWVFKDVDAAMRSRRLVAFGGVVKAYAAEIGASNMDQDGDEEDLAACFGCGSTRLVHVVGRWTGDGYLWRRDI